jgi:hypothetical protein
MKSTSRGGMFSDILASMESQLSWEQVDEIAQGAVDAMADKLDKSIKRSGSTENLRNNLTVSLVQQGNGNFTIGIGDRELLNKNCPYWYVLNYGFMYGSKRPYIPNYGRGTKGRFEGDPWEPVKGYKAGKGSLGQHWNSVHSEFGGWYNKTSFMKPKKAIEPVNYIEAGEKYITKRLNRFKGTSLGKKTTRK